MPPAAILRFLLSLWATIATIFVVDRVLIFFFLSSAPLSDMPGLDLVLAFAVGSVRDMALAALLIAPALLLFMLSRRLWRSQTGRIVASAAAVVLVGSALFGGVAELFFWNEFDSRFNGVAVNYLMFPREVIGNIRESFNLALYLPMIAAAALIIIFIMRRRLSASLDAVPTASRRSALAACLALMAVGAGIVWLLPNSISANREINQIAASGVATFVDAAITNNTDYDGVYPGMPKDKAIELVRQFYSKDQLLDPPGTRSIRRFVDNGNTPRKLNIVIVIEETFGSIFTDSLDNRRNEIISPNIDRLARDGVFFTNIYASGDRTVRGLEAVLTSFQPIPGISTARRPGSLGMFSLPSVLKQLGYETAMLYAGSDAFDNMGAFWNGIGFDHVWDEGDIEEPGFTTIWGSADEYLFGDALKKLDRMTASGKPAMLTLLTVSNHRPYEYPLGRIDKDPAEHRIENTATYADWAFGDFIERARAHPWFDDTVFVFLGDHGWKVNGAAQVPLHSFRIPILIYSPKHLAPQRVETLGGQMDLAPTLLGLLGISYESRFFGTDLMRTKPGEERIAVAHNYSIAFAKNGSAVVLEPDGSVKAYDFTPGNPELKPRATPDKDVLDLGIALTQTAHHIFYAGEQAMDLPKQPKVAADNHPAH